MSETLLFTAIFQQAYFRLKNCVSMLPHFQKHELITKHLLKGQIVINEFLKRSLRAAYLHLFLHSNSRLKSRNALEKPKMQIYLQIALRKSNMFYKA